MSFRIPADVFGLCPEFQNTAAEAATAVQLMRYSLKSVLEKASSSPAIMTELMGEPTKAYQAFAHHIEKRVHCPAQARVTWFYQWLRERNVANGNEAADGVPMS